VERRTRFDASGIVCLCYFVTAIVEHIAALSICDTPDVNLFSWCHVPVTA